jgi:outer membrane protein OmpA-like peptidoglycan-associated protein
MQSRFTAKGVTADDKEVVLAYELNEEEFKVALHIVPRKALTAETLEKLEKNWVDGEAFEFPEGTEEITPNLNAESLLPDNIRSEEAGKVRTKQNEFAYTLLTAKLWESYLTELEGLKKRGAELASYDRQLFDDSKSFWERVLEHRKERDISQERLDKIKDDVNSIFEKLKTFRKSENAEFDANSSKLRDEVIAKLEDLKKRTNEKANFKALLDELKTLQAESRKNRYSKADDNQLRKFFDSVFHYINEQRNHFFSDKTASRVKGLNEVIEKMEHSLSRDKKDLEYLQRKSESNKASMLEVQLIKVKTNMLNETIASKEEKLKDIRLTLEKLVKQSAKEKKKGDKKEGGEENTGDVKDEVKNEVTEESTEDTSSAEEAAHPDEPNPSPAE